MSNFWVDKMIEYNSDLVYIEFYSGYRVYINTSKEIREWNGHWDIIVKLENGDKVVSLENMRVLKI